MKTGIFIGSFNPPTKAHLEIAKLLYNEKLVEKIVFVPVNNDKKDLVSIEHRINMLNEYCNDFNYLEVSNIMKTYPNNFNYLVLEDLSIKYNDLYIIMGSDLLNNFHNFDNYLYMLEKYHFIIIPRGNIDINSLINNYYGDYKNKFIILNYYSDISSSLVRLNINNERVASEMTDNHILDYIKENNLYKN